MLGFRPISSAPISAILDAQASQTIETTLRFASRTVVTRATDAPAHTPIEGRLVRGLQLQRRLSIAEGGQFGSTIEINFGQIVLDNADGRLNFLKDYAADGRQIRLKIGATEIDSFGRERPKAYATFALVYTGSAGAWSFEEQTVRLRIETLSNRLQGRLQPLTYAGSGGRQGTADLTGKTLPTAFGRCLNVTAQLVDPALLTYQVHSGSVDSITAVYDAAVAVPFDADYPTYEALEAASIPAGEYATCISEGFFRLATAPFGTVTADIRGDNAFDGFTGYSDEHGPVIRKILINYAGWAPAEIDTVSFAEFAALQPESMTLYLPAGDQSTIEEVVARIAFSAGAFVGDRSGLFRIQRLDLPGETVHWAFNDRDLISIERLDLPYRVPWRAWGLGYQPNWTVQNDSDVAGSVTQARRQFLKNEMRFVYALDSAIAARHRTSASIIKNSLFLDKSVAQAEVDRLIGLYNVRMALYRIVVKTALFSVHIGETIRITSSKYDLHAGFNFIAVDIDDNADNVQTAIICFGPDR